MNSKDREAWSRKLGTERKESTREGMEVKLHGTLPSKPNRHEIRFNRAFWTLISPIVHQWVDKHPTERAYWIAPDKHTQKTQESVATLIGLIEKEQFSGPLSLVITLINQPIDGDNIKIIGDALQQSGVIQNDNQIVEWRVSKRKEPTEAARVDVELRRVVS